MSLARSFRLRLALLATLVCAAVLVAFSLMVWGHVVDAATDRIDRELERVSRHHIQFVHKHEHDHELRHAHMYPPVFLGGDLQILVFWVRDQSGTTVARSADWPTGMTAERLPAAGRRLSYATENDGGRTWRLGRYDETDRSIVVAVDLAQFDSNLHDLRLHWGLTLITALVLAFFGAWWHANRALRPVQTLTDAIEDITAHELDRRIPDTGGFTEFQRLADVCNGMLERLERSFSQAVRFSADASHEMKTPLTIMQGQVENALQSVPEGSAAQAALASQLEEIGRLKNLVRKLLLLSQADSGSLPVQRDAIDFSQSVRSLAEDIGVLAPSLGLRTEIEPGLTVEADDGLLQHLLQNLASNAMKYNREHGWIELTLSREAGWALLRVENSGEPIPRADAARVFDRFYRRDAARSRRVDGLGLGLSLAREIARAFGGDLWFDGATEDANRFCLRLPLAAISR